MIMSAEYEPRLTEPLKASYLIREGQPVKLSCRFDASPRGNIQWLKEGVPIDFEALGISRDFKVVKEVDYTALLIKEAFPEDAGSYTVVIRNSLGEARSFTQLTVEEFFCHTPESEMSDTVCKPVFVQPLLDTTINEGEKLKLRAALTAHPEPEIIWYRNNIPLKNSRDLMLTFDGQSCTLIKDRCEKENDTGVYRITAVNSMGQAESTCQVVVQSSGIQMFRERVQSTRSLPVFIQSLQDQTVQEGEKFLLQIRATGQPKPQVIWYKDNQPLRNTQDYQIRVENDVHTLEIPRISMHDAGLYQVRAISTEGEAQSSATVKISPRISMHDTGFYQTKVISTEGEAQSSAAMKISPRIPMHDTGFYQTKVISTESEAQSSAAMKMSPRIPMHDTGFYQTKVISTESEAQSSAAMKISPRIPMHDTGFYQTKVISTESEAQSSAGMKISPRMSVPEPMIIESNGHPPEFLQLFTDRKTTIGTTVQFEARLTGTQPLNVYWLFNGSPIIRAANHQRYQQNVFQNTYTLTIHNVRYEDVGRYTLNAENSWGKATCTAELYVPPTATRIGRDQHEPLHYILPLAR